PSPGPGATVTGSSSGMLGAGAGGRACAGPVPGRASAPAPTTAEAAPTAPHRVRARRGAERGRGALDNMRAAGAGRVGGSADLGQGDPVQNIVLARDRGVHPSAGGGAHALDDPPPH